MPNLALELFSEEIPARMQRRAAADLDRAARAMLKDAELDFEKLTTEVTPRRLVLLVEGLPIAQPDTKTERKGPRVGAPEKAMQGFLKSVGKSVDEVEQRETPKGTFYFATIERQGRPAIEVLAEGLTGVLSSLTWPKSMRWGDHELKWVRPLHTILCLLDDDVVPVTLGHVKAGRMTRGHRFLAPDPIEVATAADYPSTLVTGRVVLSSAQRRETIETEAHRLAAAEGCELLADDALLDEVSGLVEEPRVLVGTIDQSFMAVPAEILTTAMRSHQKYFSLRNRDGELAPRFIVVSNMETNDGGAQVVAGNETVLRARLADAKFFWDTDRKKSLESRVPALADIVFQAKFGDAARLSHKVERVESLAAWLAERTGADPSVAQRAARLSKADLVSDVVYEFPELQGIMGRYYAENDGESDAIASAIAEHYSPAGPSDACPTAPTSVAVALADKLDTLVGFFAIDEKPTGSKDPFALRRAALGVLRLLLENEVRVPLRAAFEFALGTYPEDLGTKPPGDLSSELLAFFADRLEVHLRESGVRHDLVRAVFADGSDDDLVRLVRKIRALEEFLGGEEGSNLLAGYRRASNIVRIEEKKDSVRYAEGPDESLLAESAERALYERLMGARAEIDRAVTAEDFAAAMTALASLRQPIDAFFEEVTVNADEPDVRANRLRILATIRAALGAFADFAQLEG